VTAKKKREETKIIAQGNIDEGFHFVGPFQTFADAAEWDEMNGDNLTRPGWITSMELPILTDTGMEVTDRIYNTLMGSDKDHVPLSLSRVTFQEVDPSTGVIKFNYDGVHIRIYITEEQ